MLGLDLSSSGPFLKLRNTMTDKQNNLKRSQDGIVHGQHFFQDSHDCFTHVSNVFKTSTPELPKTLRLLLLILSHAQGSWHNN